MTGKGDTPRPMHIDRATYGQRWAETFPAHTGGCRTYETLPCDTLGPNGSCLACGKPAPLDTLGDPEE